MRAFFTFLSLCFCLSVSAQVTVNFIPELNGRNVQGLLGFQLINPNGPVRVRATIIVSERVAGTVIRIRTPEFTAAPGNNTIPEAAVTGASVEFSADKTGNMIARTRMLPQGDYDYCYNIRSVNSDMPAEDQCFAYTLEPFADMNLIEPYNRDTICDKRPVMTWQPLLPAVPGASYQLVLSEVKKGQSPTEALNYNLPVLNQRDLFAPVLPYPAIAPELVTGKKYAWQVTAYKEQTILSRSEVWSFVMNCRDSVKKAPDSGESYRDVEDLARGNLYVARGVLRFGIGNPYGEQPMKFRVHPADDPSGNIKGMGEHQLKNGYNYVIIDLAENGRFRDGKYYIMEITLPNGVIRTLRFRYEEVKN
ncbi:DUF928 domain-containing protein [Mucilaginibacter conchicola]|uniref:DUF928 domain-containing protein n=2 Tax=Mucilaginibacter conchicola TaxID=2303333 RepID=A0A372NVT0_9SPHI|nr:DUF928 domain-containing protein [Mucilaginibacter conchicola]